MNINEKIESIRKQPEHVRMRWVWMCVAASMLIILVLWIFSITSMLTKNKPDSSQTTSPDMENIGQQFQNLQEQASSIKDLGSQILDSTKSPATIKNDAEPQYPETTASNPDIPESKTYSEILKKDAAQ